MISITKSERDNIELLTRGQANNPEWKAQRQLRITSSMFGPICKRTERRDIDKLIGSIINGKPVLSKAIRHGIMYEAVAREKYVAMMATEVESCGLFISEETPFLAASPDGLVSDDICIEIKCPYAAKDRPISSTNIPFLCQTGLKINHDFYYQIQGQLYCTGRQSCHFCVYTHSDFKVFEIKKDEAFISQMVEALTSFYENHFKKALIDKHVYASYAQYYL